MSDRTERAMQHLLAQVAVKGAGAITVGDGTVFGFSKQLCQQLLQDMEEKGQDHCIVFVKTSGRTIDDVEGN